MAERGNLGLPQLRPEAETISAPNLVADVLAEVDPFLCPGCSETRTSAWLRLGVCRECGQDPAQRRSGYGPEAPRQPAVLKPGAQRQPVRKGRRGA